MEKPQLVRLGLNAKEDHSNYRGRAFFRSSALVFFRIGRFDFSAAGPSKPRTRGRRFLFANVCLPYSLEIILTLTAYERAICASVSPLPRRAKASRRWWSVNFGLRPKRTPFCMARFRPSPGPLADQFTLELRDGRQHGHQQSAL
jgi:hypothetical protein